MKHAEARQTTYRKDYQPPAYHIERAEFDFAIDAAATQVTGRLRLRRAAKAKPGPLQLDGVGLTLESVAIDGQELASNQYQISDDGLTLLDPPGEFELVTRVQIQPDQNTQLEGLYQSGQFLLTQCEAEGFRKISYFLDRPDAMTTFRVRLEADRSRYPVLLSNGNLIDSGALADERHFALWDDPFPKPSYLFALVAGDLAHVEDHYTTSDGREVTLRIYVESDNLDRVDYALTSLKKSMAWDESRFGLAYDLDVYNIVATNDFNMGAMENKSLNIFNSKFVLAKPETATDRDFQAIEGVIGHEYFHNWTGNRVTCRDWFQLSLKEGLTVFRDQEFSSDMQSRAVKRIEDVRSLRTYQFAEDAGPMAHPVRPDSFVQIDNFYTMTVYEKGAEVVRMYHTLLGEEGFQKGMRLYFERHDGQAVTCNDFRIAMADANAVDLSQFERWYLQAGTPVVEVSGDHDAQANTYTLTFTQHTPPTPGQPDKQPLHIPVRLGLLDANGHDLPLVTGAGEVSDDVLELREATETVVFNGIQSPPVPSLFRGFSAPVKLRYDYSLEQLAFLMASDSDPFNRWDAGQKLIVRIVLQIVDDSEQPVPDVYLDAVGHSLKAAVDGTVDPALIAEALTIPDENYLAGVIADTGAVADVERIHDAVWAVRAALAERHQELLVETYQRLASPAEYSLAPAAIATRSLRNLCLAYLAAGDEFELAERQFSNAANMTDSVAALRALVHYSAPGGAAALQAFHQRWHRDALIMDKWLAVQATDPGHGALDRINALLAHPTFNIKNPNKVRALIGAFSTANPVVFHAADGAGYRWLADRVLELDPMNPHVASRLVRAFDPWRRYDRTRQQLVRAQLERLSAAGLSVHVTEIVDKALAPLPPTDGA